MPNGLVILNKDAGMTSHTAVARLSRLFGGETAGHTGTLDPMATGVLPVLIGRAVKASEYLTEGDKHYIATLQLGLTTDTEDITGTVLHTCTAIPDEATVLAAVQGFVGQISQIPPMYSAIKVGGKKLMELARAGKTVEREARSITVYRLTAQRQSDTDYTLDVVCSKGTYIRTLCSDIGASLGCGGVMASLCRAEAAGFPLSASHTLAELEGMPEEARAACVIPVEELFRELPAVVLPDFFARLVRNGQAPAQEKLRLQYPAGTRVRLCDKDGFFALGEITSGEPAAVRAIKLFVL
jgi:tRNA pseudouridine55 synthase